MITAAKLQLPQPMVHERPTSYADRIGQLYANSALLTERRLLGQFFTPVEVADFMARLSTVVKSSLRILDPGAGTGVLACALCETLAASGEVREIDLDMYEADERLADDLEKSLLYLKDWLRQKAIRLTFRIHREDFVLANAEALAEKASLFVKQPMGGYDLIIANPPYFKLPKSDARAQAAEAIVCGQPNIYAIFMAVSAALLKNGGEMICITPRSYAAGSYFRLFREKFFGRMQPHAIHLFDSRTETFGRDDILQESLILKAMRADGWAQTTPDQTVEISRSAGWRDLPERQIRRVPIKEILDLTDKDKILHLLLGEEDHEIVSLMRQWPGSLHRYGLEISTGPVVPFRATEFINQTGDVPQTHAPLLWMQNVGPMRIQWPVSTKNKAQFIAANNQSRYLLVKNRNYVLLRRFSAKEAARRLVAAPWLADDFDSSFVGLENHLNYVHRHKGAISKEEAYGLAAIFNSALIDTYFRTFNGNTQVSATELRTMPLPKLESLEELGQQVINSALDLASIDLLVNQLFRMR